MAAIDVGRLTEDEARTILENIRWPEGIKCPHCGSKMITKLNGSVGRDGLIQCNQCRNQFTVTVGTVMQGSHITLRQWIQAFYAMCSSKKGVSALQLQRNLGLGSYRSAWHLAHRIRLAMREDPMIKLMGIVEVDETYVGGKPRKGDGEVHRRGRGTKKTPVVALVQRGGKVISRPVEKVNADTLKGAIKEGCHKNTRIMTDEWPAYRGIGKDFQGHEVVKHNSGEYARGEINTNTVESYFSLLKRGLHGIFHHVSKDHLYRYCDEFNFRWNWRSVKDGERATEAIKGFVGKRLSYKEKNEKNIKH
jgi:transposase-like protein